MIIKTVCLMCVTLLSTLNSAVRVELRSFSNKKKDKYICSLLKYIDYPPPHHGCQSHIHVTLDCDGKCYVFCSTHLLHLEYKAGICCSDDMVDGD
jgi:hypothetical protein